jgi:hypothetical protein
MNYEKIPEELINTKYRKEMWKNSQKILKKLEKILPISSIHLLGSFTTKKKRPADVDFIIMIQTKDKNPKSKWSVDISFTPNNKFGKSTLEDAKKWMKQKYGTKKSVVIRIK